MFGVEMSKLDKVIEQVSAKHSFCSVWEEAGLHIDKFVGLLLL